MKCLFLTDAESPDYGESLLWEGLVRVLGAENVYDYPIKPSFHNGYMEQVPYGPFGWQQPGTPPAWHTGFGKGIDNKFVDEMVKVCLIRGFFDIIISGSMRGEPIENLKDKGLYELAKSQGIPVAVYDGWDNQFIQEFMLPYCDYYFKREMPGPSDNPKIIHYPFSIPDGLLKTPKQWQEDRAKAEIDVLFIMGNSHSKRVEMYWKIKEWMGSGKAKLRWEAYLTGSVDQALPYEKYLALLDNSKYAISLVGGGEDTMRFWEILGRTGLIHDEPKLQVIRNTEHDKRGLTLAASDYESMGPVEIEEFLINFDKGAELIARRFFKQAPHHTASARARNLIATITGEYE